MVRGKRETGNRERNRGRSSSAWYLAEMHHNGPPQPTFPIYTRGRRPRPAATLRVFFTIYGRLSFVCAFASNAFTKLLHAIFHFKNESRSIRRARCSTAKHTGTGDSSERGHEEPTAGLGQEASPSAAPAPSNEWHLSARE